MKRSPTVQNDHCGAALRWGASFMKQYGAENRPHVGNTAQCSVCKHWFAYYYVGPRAYLLTDGSSQESVEHEIGALSK